MAAKTLIYEAEAESLEEAVWQVRDVWVPQELPHEDLDDYQYTAHRMEGRVVYPHREQP